MGELQESLEQKIQYSYLLQKRKQRRQAKKGRKALVSTDAKVYAKTLQEMKADMAKENETKVHEISKHTDQERARLEKRLAARR